MNRIILYFGLPLIIALALTSNQTSAMGFKQKSEGKSLYIYSGHDLSRFLKKIGYSDYWGPGSIIERNSSGSEIRFFNREKTKAVIVDCNGTVREIEIPGYPTWLNDEMKPVAWHDQSRGLVYYLNGVVERISETFGPSSGPDPSGRYFMKYPIPSKGIPSSQSCITNVYAIDRPDKSIAEVKACGIRKLFFKNGKIFLFGHTEQVQDRTILAHILQPASDGLRETEVISIKPPRASPSPFYVIDFSPWDDKVLFIDVNDLPFRSVLYEYDLKTHEMNNISKVPYSGGWSFYLQCDILNNAMKKEEKPKTGSDVFSGT